MGKKMPSEFRFCSKRLNNKQYNEALDSFNTFSSDCKTKDAKVSACGKAEALNGLGQYGRSHRQSRQSIKSQKTES
jgi:hypothetical protein